MGLSDRVRVIQPYCEVIWDFMKSLIRQSYCNTNKEQSGNNLIYFISYLDHCGQVCKMTLMTLKYSRLRTIFSVSECAKTHSNLEFQNFLNLNYAPNQS